MLFDDIYERRSVPRDAILFALGLRKAPLDLGASIHAVRREGLPLFIVDAHIQRDAIAIDHPLAQPAHPGGLDDIQLVGSGAVEVR